MFLVWICSRRGPWLGVGSEKVSCSGLVPQSSQAWVHPDPQKTWLRPTPSEVLDSCPDPQGSWLSSIPLKVPDSHLNPQWSGSDSLAQRLLPCTCSCGVCCLRSVLAQVAGSVLVNNVSGLGQFPFPWSLLFQAHSGLGSWFSPTPVE